MRVAYEHIRLVSSDELAKAITESYLEDEIANTDLNGLQALDSLERDDAKDVYEDIFGTDSHMDDFEQLQPIGASTTLLPQISNKIGNLSKEIDKINGTVTTDANGRELESTQQQKLDDIYRILGETKLTRSKMECAPAWILDKSL